jgi:hypothetical protein
MTVRLRHQDRRAAAAARREQLDHRQLATWAAVRHELTARGEPVLVHR